MAGLWGMKRKVLVPHMHNMTPLAISVFKWEKDRKNFPKRFGERIWKVLLISTVFHGYEGPESYFHICWSQVRGLSLCTTILFCDAYLPRSRGDFFLGISA
jgi:hypothetical protein